MPYKDPEDRRRYQREWVKAKRQASKERVSLAFEEANALGKHDIAQYEKRLKEEVEQSKKLFKPWYKVWNEEVAKMRKGLVETKSKTCPYCDKFPKVIGTDYTNWVALAEHVQNKHPEKYLTMQRSYHTQMFNNLKSWDQHAKENQKLRENQIVSKQTIALLVKEVQLLMALVTKLAEELTFSTALGEAQNTLYENLQASIPGKFKGHSPPLKHLTETEGYADTEKEMREAARKKEKKRNA